MRVRPFMEVRKTNKPLTSIVQHLLFYFFRRVPGRWDGVTLIELTITNISIVPDFAPLDSLESQATSERMMTAPHSWLLPADDCVNITEFLQCQPRQVVFSKLKCDDLQECWPCLAWEPPTNSRNTTHNNLIVGVLRIPGQISLSNKYFWCWDPRW